MNKLRVVGRRQVKFLASRGVGVLDAFGMLLGCVQCGGTWHPMQRPRQHRNSRGYWKCPHNRCNADFHTITRKAGDPTRQS